MSADLGEEKNREENGDGILAGAWEADCCQRQRRSLHIVRLERRRRRSASIY